MADHITHDSTEPTGRIIPLILRRRKYDWVPFRIGAILAHLSLLLFGLKGGFLKIYAGDPVGSLEISLAILIGSYGAAVHIFWALFGFARGPHGEELTDPIMIIFACFSMGLDAVVACFDGPHDIYMAAFVASAFSLLMPMLSYISFISFIIADVAQYEAEQETARLLSDPRSSRRERYVDTADVIDV